MTDRPIKQRKIPVGDKVTVVPVSHFVKERHDMFEVWQLVGPTIQRNYRNSNPQQLYCIAFIEGMRMASFCGGKK